MSISGCMLSNACVGVTRWDSFAFASVDNRGRRKSTLTSSERMGERYGLQQWLQLLNSESIDVADIKSDFPSPFVRQLHAFAFVPIHLRIPL